jgi:hypothetical protein
VPQRWLRSNARMVMRCLPCAVLGFGRGVVRHTSASGSVASPKLFSRTPIFSIIER